MSRFLSLTTATGALLGLALSVLGAVSLRLVGLEGFAPATLAGLVAGLGVGLLGGVWIEQGEAAREQRDRTRRGQGYPPGADGDGDSRRHLFGPLAFGLTFVTLGSFMGLRAAQELAVSPTWAGLGGLAWLTLAIAGGAGGIITGAIWEVVVARIQHVARP